MCRGAPGRMKVLVCSSWDQERWPIVACTQVLFVYLVHQHDFALGWSLFLGSVSIEDPYSGDNCYSSKSRTCTRFLLLFLSLVEGRPFSFNYYSHEEGVFWVNICVSAASCHL